MRSTWFALGIVALGLTSGSALGGQNFAVGGIVFSEPGNPLFTGVSGVTVTLSGNGFDAMTMTTCSPGPGCVNAPLCNTPIPPTLAGQWVFCDVPQGNYTLDFELNGECFHMFVSLVPDLICGSQAPFQLVVNDANNADNQNLQILAGEFPDDDCVCQTTECTEDEDCPDDGNACTDEACVAGACAHPATDCGDDNACTDDDCAPAEGCSNTQIVCDDGSPCTVDGCDESTGCTVENMANGSACDDGDSCTEDDACNEGTCAGQDLECSDDNDCTSDSCDDGKCVNTPVADGTACSDGNGCTDGDACSAGACAGSPKDCDDGNECTDDSCASDECTHDNVSDGTACDDGDACTQDDVCTAGDCGGQTKDCDDNDPCTTDSCLNGECAYGNAADGTACDDDDPCTESDACSDGECGGTQKDCDDGNGCTVDACNENGNCASTVLTDGTACDDGDECTSNDVCTSGICSGTGENCNDGNACTADSCVSGECAFSNVADGTACNDGQNCTQADQCTAGACGGSPISCTGFDGPCTMGVCNPANGVCQAQAANNGQPCSDGNACTSNDLCTGGACVGSDIDCGDDNPCTVDSCDEVDGCETEPKDCPNACNPNTGECIECAAGGPECPDDGNACTTEVCDDGDCGFTQVTCPQGFQCDPGDGACKSQVPCGSAMDADIYMILDRTGTTSAASRANENNAAQELLSDFATNGEPPPVGLGAFGCNGAGFPGGQACTLTPLSTPYGDNDGPGDGDHYATIDKITATESSVGTHYAAALNAAAAELAKGTSGNKVVVMFSDGADEDPLASTLAAANALKASGVEIFSILFESDESDDASVLLAIASEPKDTHFFNSPDSQDLDSILGQITSQLGCESPECFSAECVDGFCELTPLPDCEGCTDSVVQSFTVGGLVFSDVDQPLESGLAGVEVTIDCPVSGYHAVTETDCDPAGLWLFNDVPCGTCSIDLGAFPCTDGFNPPPPIAIVVNQANEAANQNLQFVGGFLINDMDGDNLLNVFDANPWVVCLFPLSDGFTDCSLCADPGCECRGDCNLDGLFTIAGDLPCFVDCIFHGQCGDCDRGPLAVAPGIRRASAPRRGGTVGGIVYRDAAQPLTSGVKGADVTLVDAASGLLIATVKTDHIGIWRFDGVVDGSYVVIYEGGEHHQPLRVNDQNEVANQNLTWVHQYSGAQRTRAEVRERSGAAQ